jgi:hypothetical protein
MRRWVSRAQRRAAASKRRVSTAIRLVLASRVAIADPAPSRRTMSRAAASRGGDGHGRVRGPHQHVDDAMGPRRGGARRGGRGRVRDGFHRDRAAGPRRGRRRPHPRPSGAAGASGGVLPRPAGGALAVGESRGGGGASDRGHRHDGGDGRRGAVGRDLRRHRSAHRPAADRGRIRQRRPRAGRRGPPRQGARRRVRHRAGEPLREPPHQHRLAGAGDDREGRGGQHLHPPRHLPHEHRGEGRRQRGARRPRAPSLRPPVRERPGRARRGLLRLGRGLRRAGGHRLSRRPGDGELHQHAAGDRPWAGRLAPGRPVVRGGDGQKPSCATRLRSTG